MTLSVSEEIMLEGEKHVVHTPLLFGKEKKKELWTNFTIELLRVLLLELLFPWGRTDKHTEEAKAKI